MKLYTQKEINRVANETMLSTADYFFQFGRFARFCYGLGIFMHFPILLILGFASPILMSDIIDEYLYDFKKDTIVVGHIADLYGLGANEYVNLKLQKDLFENDWFTILSGDRYSVYILKDQKNVVVVYEEFATSKAIDVDYIQAKGRTSLRSGSKWDVGDHRINLQSALSEHKIDEGAIVVFDGDYPKGFRAWFTCVVIFFAFISMFFIKNLISGLIFVFSKKAFMQELMKNVEKEQSK